MKKCLALVVLLCLTLTGCGFHLKYNTEVPEQFKVMRFSSYDPYGALSRALYEQFSDNNVTLVNRDSTASYPTLKIISSSISNNSISLYQDGKAAEKLLVLTVSGQMMTNSGKVYPITVRVSRTFFDNPGTALAKTTEQSLIEKEMYSDAALQIITKLKSFGSRTSS